MKITTAMLLLLFIIPMIPPVLGASENNPKDFLSYINGVTSKDPSEYTTVYDNVFIFGVGHNQQQVDRDYKVDGKWVIEGKEYDLAIAPYSGGAIDWAFASLEHVGVPIVSDKAFAPYKGALFRNIFTHSGGGLAFKNQAEYGTIDYEKATLYAYPKSFSEEVDPRDTLVINRGDPIPFLPWVKYEPIGGKPGVKFGWTIRFGQGESSIEKGPGKGHYLKEYLKKETGGIDFTSISLNYLSVRNNSFDYAIKAQKTSDLNQNVTLENNTELSFTSFFTGLVLPESEFWVNLNPWEPDRIIETDLGSTDVGRIMLEADLAMKRSFSSYENPGNGEIGMQFWDLLDKKKVELMNGIMAKHPSEIKDVSDVQFSPVTRHWIVPDKVEAYENGDEIYIVSATLNINSEPVYEQSTYSLANTQTVSESTKQDLEKAAKEYGSYVKELQESMILPLVVQDVNHSRNYSDLRQIYVSLALAQWYKNEKGSQLVFSDIMNSRNLDGLESRSEWSSMNVYNEYKKSFEEGDYRYWKNSTYRQGDNIMTESKLYTGGGVDFENIKITNLGNMPQNLKTSVSGAVYDMFSRDNQDYYFGDELIFAENSQIASQDNGGQETEKKQETSEFATILAIIGVVVAVSAIVIAAYVVKAKKDQSLKGIDGKRYGNQQV